MKKPSGTPAIPFINPALGDPRCLIHPGRAARFCQLRLTQMGSNLDRFTRQNALLPSFVLRLLTEKERPYWADKPWRRYGQQLRYTLARLGYPTAVVWVSGQPAAEPGPVPPGWLLQLTSGKARRFANEEEALPLELLPKAA